MTEGPPRALGGDTLLLTFLEQDALHDHGGRVRSEWGCLRRCLLRIARRVCAIAQAGLLGLVIGFRVRSQFVHQKSCL